MQRHSPPPPRPASADPSTNATPPTSNNSASRRSPPPPSHQQPPQYHPPPPHQYQYAHPHHAGPQYMYAPPPPPPQYAHHPQAQDDPRNAQHASPYAHPYGGYVPYPYPGAPMPSSAPPAAPNSMNGVGAPGIAVIHTDDAATKLSDRVRRRCFNCCTTETSTWRRSNLSPGKVLCNKCGLFERTHSRPRPEQFPHKRGPLAASTLRSGGSGGGGQQQAQVGYQPYPPPNAAPNSGAYVPAPQHDSASAPPGGYAPVPNAYAPPPSGAYAPPPATSQHVENQHQNTNGASNGHASPAPQPTAQNGGSISHPGTPQPPASVPTSVGGKSAVVGGGSRPASRAERVEQQSDVRAEPGRSPE
ncbi:hypothetical protein B0H16DRAFT_1756840 [Mycena metata]|uniref:GATA-type domain-containing protein n=1 Tax=Mycena metata TaxID=1033252 RepID=A0AAD7NUG8_9AGAR|nr:hypothetical protein B0H16DRAFT_1756840 [Mycena metata]